ncbi:rhomboid family intramembrane serine protease [Huintestinicola sp.]|uniref:rhomboid family intramembrane serine protease n=1 Tax=Huintestinicola sp. TaxID=2981661 RepID=UPI003D7D0DC0
MKLPKVTYNSPVILTFTLLSLAAVILGMITGGGSTGLLFSVYKSSLADPLFYVRLFTHVLGHADLSHFMGNFTIILLVGPMLEEKYGGKRLLVMIAFTALVTGLINVIFFPHVALLGASGVAFMMILLSSFANSRSGEIPLTLIFVAVLYLGTEIINGIFAQDNISQMAHIIGGGCGCLFGWLIGRGKLNAQ